MSVPIDRRTAVLGLIAMIGTHAMADDLPPSSLARLEPLRARTGAGPRQLTGITDLDASIDRVFHAVSEIEGMKGWMAGLTDGIYENRESSSPIVPGTMRRLSFGSVADAERVVAAEAPHLLAYSIVGGMPIRDHLAVMQLVETGGATRLFWHQCFAVTPLIGFVRRRRVRGFVENSLAALSARMGGGTPRIC